MAVSARTIIPLHTDNTGVQVAAVFRQIISQRLAGQLAATGREILQVIIPAVREASQESQLQSMSEGLQAGPGVRIHFFAFRHDGPGTEVYGRPRDPFSSAFVSSRCAASGLFREPTFLAHILFAVIPESWITVAPLLREKALLTA